MNAWLISPEAFAPIAAAIKQGLTPTAEQMVQFDASFSEGDYPGARIMNKAGPIAQINIRGVLSKEPSWMLRFFGGGNTAYSEIISAIAEAERDPTIEEIIFSIDSPGGQTSGLTRAMDAIKYTKKPTSAEVEGMAASAAYGLASQADKVIAMDRGSMVGSIGIKATFFVDPTEVEITSSNAPEKAPDPTTEEGQTAIRKMLDALEAVFIEDIADGRGVTVDKVKSDYGRGGVFLAKDALTHGMIDAISENPRSQNTPGATTPTQEAKTMDLQELKAKHPETYQAAFNEGVAKERDRVSAHLTMGDASKDMKTAIDAVKDGSEMTASLQATYLAAGMKNAAIGARATDEEIAGGAANVTPGATTPADQTATDNAFFGALTGEVV